MKMEIREPIQPIDVLGSLEVTSLNLEDRKREVYLDGKRVPKALETIILTGLDAMSQEYASCCLRGVMIDAVRQHLRRDQQASRPLRATHLRR